MNLGKLFRQLGNKIQQHLFKQSSKLQVFETSVGVKYKNGWYDSNRFDDYTVDEIPFLSSGCSFDNLLLPPDLLRNEHTSCGKSILQSPHYSLMSAIESHSSLHDCDYIKRASAGTLDGRLPSNPSLKLLVDYYQTRKTELTLSNTFVVMVLSLANTNYGGSNYMLVDGKHRAVLAAYLDKPHLLCLRLVSAKFAEDPFFQSIYSYVLQMDTKLYSVNQKMIRAILNE